MADTITKFIFRRGTDITRRQGGGNGVKLNVSEPAYCIDTKRVFIGDGIDANGTIGGIPVTFRNHGKFDTFFGPTTASFSSSVYSALTSNGAEVGDLLFDNANKVLYYISVKDPLSAVPDTSGITRFDLLSRISNQNGVSAVKTQEVLNISLDPNFFAINNTTGINLLSATAIGSVGNPIQFTGYGPIVGNSTLQIGSTTQLNRSVTIGQPGTHATLSAYGSLVVSDVSNQFTTQGYSSNDWVNGWTTLNSSSATWNSTTSSLANLTPFSWQWNTTGTPIISTFASNTRVGINTFPTFQGLSIKGTSTLATALSVNGSIVTTGDCTVFSTSDINLKQNVRVIVDAVQALESIRGVRFDWKPEFQEGSDYGVIAQEVEVVFPEMVTAREGGTKGVNYIKLIPVLIEAVKELNKKVERLK